MSRSDNELVVEGHTNIYVPQDQNGRDKFKTYPAVNPRQRVEKDDTPHNIGVAIV